MPNEKLAIALWRDRVSAAFDFARRVLVVELSGPAEVSRTEVEMPAGLPVRRVEALRAHGVDVLICGAISRPLARLVVGWGIELVPFVRGTVDEVLQAYKAGRLGEPGFLLPGFRPGLWAIPGGRWWHGRYRRGPGRNGLRG